MPRMLDSDALFFKRHNHQLFKLIDTNQKSYNIQSDI